MICTLTARWLKPGAFEAFREAFEKAGVEDVPQGIVKRWSRVYVCRDVSDENVALTFGFFEGTLEDLREIQRQGEGGPRKRDRPDGAAHRGSPARRLLRGARGDHAVRAGRSPVPLAPPTDAPRG